jgi:hypothetical protein
MDALMLLLVAALAGISLLLIAGCGALWGEGR